MIIDVHAHYHPRAYNEALERAGVVRAGRGSMPGHPDTKDDDAIHRRAEGASALLRGSSRTSQRAPPAAL